MKKIIAGIGIVALIATYTDVHAQKGAGKMWTLPVPSVTIRLKKKIHYRFY